MTHLFYDDKTVTEEVRILGITNFVTSTIYLDKDLDGFILAKTLRHELTHVYLWETGQQDRVLSEEEICDLMSVAAPIIHKTVEEILFRLKEGLYKNGE